MYMFYVNCLNYVKKFAVFLQKRYLCADFPVTINPKNLKPSK